MNEKKSTKTVVKNAFDCNTEAGVECVRALHATGKLPSFVHRLILSCLGCMQGIS